MSQTRSEPTPDEGASTRYRVRCVERVLDILDLLSGSDHQVTLQQVAEVTGLPRSSAFRYLAILETRGYAARVADSGAYRLAPRFPLLHDPRLDALITVVRPHLVELGRRTGETVNLGVLSGTRVVYVDIVESPRQVRLAARVGDRDPLHCTALGKAIAARLPTEEVRRILGIEGMPRQTPRTLTDIEAYVAELDTVREDGYALDDGENEHDGRCVAVSLPDHHLRAAWSVSAPASRTSREDLEALAGDLRRAAGRLASEAGWST